MPTCSFSALLFKIFTYCYYFWLHWVFFAVPGLSLVVAGGGVGALLFVVAYGLLIALTSLVVEHGLLGHVGFSSCGA